MTATKRDARRASVPAQRQSRDGEAVAFERQPPQDLDAEQSALGGMLLSKDAIADVVEALSPEDFRSASSQDARET